jgi:uridine kinase
MPTRCGRTRLKRNEPSVTRRAGYYNALLLCLDRLLGKDLIDLDFSRNEMCQIGTSATAYAPRDDCLVSGDRSLTPHGALDVVTHVADRIMLIPLDTPRVAIDGPDGAGKTRFADRLADVLQSRHRRAAVRISVDDFHNVRAIRYRQGRDSPSGFWADSYDYNRFRRDVLEPFAPGGSRRFRRASYSHATDEILHPIPETAVPGAVLVVDGIFLQRAEISAHWDLTVFLDVKFTETAERMARRDGTPSDPDHPQMRRYVEGQRAYFRQCRPRERAHIVVDNNDFDEPKILRDQTAEPS